MHELQFSTFPRIFKILTLCEFFGGRGLEQTPPRDFDPLPPSVRPSPSPLVNRLLVSLTLDVIAVLAQSLQVVLIKEAIGTTDRIRDDVISNLRCLDDAV